MKVTTEELERCEILMTIEAEPAQEQDLLKKAAGRISRQVQIPGFRPGKAPYNTILRRFGLESIQQEALEHSGEKIVTDALKEADLNPQAPLKFDEVSWQPLTIKVRVPGPPVVELGNYREIRLEAKAVEITTEDVDEALKLLQEQNATWAPVERPAELGDLLTMSVVEKDGDEILAENEATEYELVAPEETEEEKNGTSPDFVTPLLGLSAGDSKTFTITYPDNWDAERYAGKEITFEVEVSSVKEKELDELDDDFAQSVSEVETLKELREELRSNIEWRRRTQYDHELGHQVLDKILADAKIEWPEALEEYQIDQELEGLQKRLEQAGLNLDSYLSMQNKTQTELRQEIRERVVKSLKNGLVLSKVAELEGLKVSQTEILERAKAIAHISGADDRFWQGVLSSQSYQASIATDLLTNKTFERLALIAKGEAPEPGAEIEAVEAITSTIVAADTSPAGPVEAKEETAEVSAEVSTGEVASEEAIDKEHS
ncbi:MAG: trigger factor [Anaerolineae bacterium]|nr:trigger factor [Anaerolineae bacterium]